MLGEIHAAGIDKVEPRDGAGRSNDGDPASAAADRDDAGTALAHGVLLALVLVAAQRAKPATNIVYEVNLVAAPLPNPEVHNAAPQATPSAPKTWRRRW